ncbi:MAG: insulinase family protein [Endomicrobium sp.]|jgi:predicted Zn-dependent peptidase|nr:insulinase family protein [Endomicrobium sp.]
MRAKTVKYKNGLKLVLKNNKNNFIASVVIFVKVGSVNEQFFQSGLSHFLEHLMFKGSKNYPGDLACKNIENMGGYINAVTTKEYTMYYVNIQKNGMKKCIKILADIIQNPLFSKYEIDKERKVVIEEIRRYFDNPVAVLYEKFYESIYVKSTLKNSVIGKLQIIENISYKEIYNYYKMHYVPSNIVLSISGDFNELKIKKVVDETFGKFPKRFLPTKPLFVEDVHNRKDVIDYGKVGIGYMLSGFLGPSLDEEDIYIANLAVDILGGGKSSRLYRSLYEEKHLVFSIVSFFVHKKEAGNICIMSVFNPKNMMNIKNEIKNQIQNIIDIGVTKKELDRAKLSIKTNLNFSFETSIDVAENIGYWHLMNNSNFMTKYIRKLNKITTTDIKDFFEKYYLSKTISNVALLPKTFASYVRK